MEIEIGREDTRNGCVAGCPRNQRVRRRLESHSPLLFSRQANVFARALDLSSSSSSSFGSKIPSLERISDWNEEGKGEESRIRSKKGRAFFGTDEMDVVGSSMALW